MPISNWFARLYPDNIDNSEFSSMKQTKSKFVEGLKVRDRRVSLSMPQIYGRVESVKDGILTIEWDIPDNYKVKEEKFDMSKNMPLIERRIAIVGE